MVARNCKKRTSNDFFKRDQIESYLEECQIVRGESSDYVSKRVSVEFDFFEEGKFRSEWLDYTFDLPPFLFSKQKSSMQCIHPPMVMVEKVKPDLKERLQVSPFPWCIDTDYTIEERQVVWGGSSLFRYLYLIFPWDNNKWDQVVKISLERLKLRTC